MSRAIFDSAQRVLDLLENLLQWGRLQIGRAEYQPRRLDLSQLVKQNGTQVSALPATTTQATRDTDPS